jgi:hypothetical protein
MTLDRYGHLMPGQAESVAQRLSQAALARSRLVPGDVATPWLPSPSTDAH